MTLIYIDSGLIVVTTCAELFFLYGYTLAYTCRMEFSAISCLMWHIKGITQPSVLHIFNFNCWAACYSPCSASEEADGGVRFWVRHWDDVVLIKSQKQLLMCVGVFCWFVFTFLEAFVFALRVE